MNQRSKNDPFGYVGTLLANRYQIEELIGLGGMGMVYRAKHVVMNKTVAVKLLQPQFTYGNPEVVEQFLNEARATAGLEHPHIIKVLDADLAEETAFMAMEYLDGQTLEHELADKNPLPLERVVAWFEQIAEGVDYAHRKGIIHRDLKPGNMMIVADHRGDEVVKILDFGIAKALTTTAKVSRPIGTLYYASPEQLSQGASIDHRSDLYSLGVILYQMLTGCIPFEGESTEPIIYHKLHSVPPPLRQIQPEIPPSVEEVVLKALATEPSQRHQSVTELIRALQRAITLETGVLQINCVDKLKQAGVARAAVYINDWVAGHTDPNGHWRQVGLLPRQYLIQVECSGYKRWHTSVRVIPREEFIVTVEMVREPKGELLIACGVAGAQVELGARKIGVTGQSGRLYIESVAAGKHVVKIHHPEFLPVELEVEVPTGEQIFLEAELSPCSHHNHDRQVGTTAQSFIDRVARGLRLLRRPVTIVAIVALLAAGLAFYWLRLSGQFERKLETTLAQGNLLAPPGYSAFDYYQRLKGTQDGAGSLIRLSDKLFQIINTQASKQLSELIKAESYASLSEFVQTESKAPLTAWEEVLRLFNWAQEVKPGNASISSRVYYCAGRIAWVKKDEKKALEQLKHAAELDKSWDMPGKSTAMLSTLIKVKIIDGLWELTHRQVKTRLEIENGIGIYKTMLSRGVVVQQVIADIQDSSLHLRCTNPVDASTGTTSKRFAPDELWFSQQHDGSFLVWTRDGFNVINWEPVTVELHRAK